jgi:hypothetical protein
MAEVFADDIALNYTGSEQYLTLLYTHIDDPGGNNNGHLDPGETADLTAVLKNIGGMDFTNLSTTIQSSDPYITIIDDSGYFGSLAVDSVKENTSDPYTLTASASTPTGYAAPCQLLVTDGGFADTFDFDIIIGRMHYLVWNPDPTPESGEAIDEILTSLGYSGNISTTLPTAELDYYYAVFVCVGIYSNNYIIDISSAEASALVDFVTSGGRMYLEGGDVWYYDPPYQSGYDFGPLFGINASADGTSNLGPVVGLATTFTEGMNFTYDGENNYIDHIDPTGTGFTIFRDGNDAYNCGVASDAGTYQTVGMSFELGSLVDGSGVTRRDTLLERIMNFFGLNLVVAEENSSNTAVVSNIKLTPNPFRNSITIRWQNVNSAVPTRITIYDATGRAVKQYDEVSLRHVQHAVWDGRDNRGNALASGIYFVHVETEQQKTVDKIILIE